MDRDKVIKALECCLEHEDCNPWTYCANPCPYGVINNGNGKCFAGLMEDALALLKEQETMMQCIKEKCRICPHCSNCDVDEDGLLKKHEASPWISVRERLPEADHFLPEGGLAESKPMLVYGVDPDGRKGYGVATYLTDPNDESWNEWDGVMVSVVDAIYCEITHWAPIPDAPKEADYAIG